MMQAAMYDGLCVVCDRPHIRVGDEILAHGQGWAAVECASAKERLRGVAQLVAVEMAARGVALGIAPEGSGLRSTGTRSEFYREAEHLGLVSSGQMADLYLIHGRGWDYALND